MELRWVTKGGFHYLTAATGAQYVIATAGDINAIMVRDQEEGGWIAVQCPQGITLDEVKAMAVVAYKMGG